MAGIGLADGIHDQCLDFVDLVLEVGCCHILYSLCCGTCFAIHQRAPS
jgi:hypothetical protein